MQHEKMANFNLERYAMPRIAEILLNGVAQMLHITILIYNLHFNKIYDIKSVTLNVLQFYILLRVEYM